MDADEHKIAGILSRLSKRTAGLIDRAKCPDEETLAKFLQGELAGKARDEVEAHLARCELCVDELVAAFKAAETTGRELDVPRRLVNRAMALIGRTESGFEIVVRLLRDSLELFSTTGWLVPQFVPVVRGEPTSTEGNALQVEQEVGRFRVAVELELTEPGVCRVLANVTEESGQPAEGVRLTLTSGDREQASFLTRAGGVVFDRIRPGEYSIAVSESGIALGRIRLNYCWNDNVTRFNYSDRHSAHERQDPDSSVSPRWVKTQSQFLRRSRESAPPV
jgi:hypothetical protein